MVKLSIGYKHFNQGCLQKMYVMFHRYAMKWHDLKQWGVLALLQTSMIYVVIIWFGLKEWVICSIRIFFVNMLFASVGL